MSPSLQGEGRVTGGGAAVTVSVSEVLLLRLPEEPLMVTVEVPVVAVPLALSVKVLLLAVLPGLNEALTPAGRPEADKVTFPLKPFCGVTITLLVPLAP